MNYSSKYLKNQLTNARKVSNDANAHLKTNPDDFVASLCARSMVNRINLLKEYQQMAGSKAKRIPKVKAIAACAAPAKRVHKTRQPRMVSGMVTPKYDNSDHQLNRIVKNKDGVLFVCNLSLLNGCV